AIRLRDAKAGARTVHLGAATVAILDTVADRTGYVVRGLNPAEPLSVNVAEKAWGRLREAAGVADGRLHDLRHTAGTFAALSGANAFAVRDLLGHRTLAMTGRYVERAADMVRATARQARTPHRVSRPTILADRTYGGAACRAAVVPANHKPRQRADNSLRR